jgi:hypothetical protein
MIRRSLRRAAPWLPLAGLPLAALLALAACGPDTSTPQGQCQAEAYQDPKVKEIRIRMLGNAGLQSELAPALDDALHAATLRCLRARGLAPPGGVEKEMPER